MLLQQKRYTWHKEITRSQLFKVKISGFTMLPSRLCQTGIVKSGSQQSIIIIIIDNHFCCAH